MRHANHYTTMTGELCYTARNTASWGGPETWPSYNQPKTTARHTYLSYLTTKQQPTWPSYNQPTTCLAILQPTNNHSKAHLPKLSYNNLPEPSSHVARMVALPTSGSRLSCTYSSVSSDFAVTPGHFSCSWRDEALYDRDIS